MKHAITLGVGILGLLAVTAGTTACDISVGKDGGFSLGIASGQAQDDWTRTYALEAGGRLEIVNVNGRITAEAGDGPSVEISAERVAKATTDASAKELLDKIEMREEISDARVRVEVRAPRVTAGGHEVTWTIRVPKGVSVDLRTVNGGVRLNGLDGEVRAKSTNGGINGRALRATTLEAAVTNGGVDIQLIDAPARGTFDLESVNGGISLALPSESRAEVTARCVNGGISISDLDLQIEGEQSRRRLQGRLNGGGARVTLETTNGGIKLSRTQIS